MPTRKQRRREAKEKRHTYEFVYLDAEGNELEEPPEGFEEEPAAKESRRNGSAKPAARKQAPPQRGARAGRQPQPPSWQRAGKRALILGVIVFAIFALGARKNHNGYLGAAALAALYTALFVPFTYALDRFTYRRFEARRQGGAAAKPTKKR